MDSHPGPDDRPGRSFPAPRPVGSGAPGNPGGSWHASVDTHGSDLDRPRWRRRGGGLSHAFPQRSIRRRNSWRLLGRRRFYRSHEQPARKSLKLLRIGILTLLAFSVLAFGGVEDWARAVFESATAVLFLFWAVLWSRRPAADLFVSPLVPPLAALCVLVFLQWIVHLSASPFATRIEFQLLLADAMFLFLATQAFRTAGDWKGFFWFIISFGFAVSLLGILQHRSEEHTSE